MNCKAVAIITARGGSKRIPNKNIKNFCGKPILSYSIQAALDSKLFDEVMVSTDSNQIADIAKKFGAQVPFMRSEETASDYATTADVLLEVLSEYKKSGKNFDYMACIYPTAPFVTPRKLAYGFDLLKKENGVMIMPVVAFSYPPQRSYVIRQNMLSMKWKENMNKRSQDLETFYHDSGQFYLFDIKKFIDKKGQISDGIYPIIMNELEVQDVDTEIDWKLAEMKYKLFCEKSLY